jgi:DNA-binding cell septation regulator SpoVG
MKIEKITFRSAERGKIIGFATLYFDNGLMLDGFPIIDGNKGLFAGWPSASAGKDSDGKTIYKPTVSTTDKGFFKYVSDEIIKQYKEQYKGSRTTVAPKTETPPDDDIFG